MTTPSETSAPVCFLPSEKTIAFAMAVVRSKPVEMEIREYISLLRQHIAPRRREAAVSSGHSHLDRSAFWRAEAERERGRVRDAEGEVVGLRREVERLKVELQSRPTTGTTKKRKKVGDEDVVAVVRSPKRVRRTDVAELMGEVAIRTTNGDDEFASAGESFRDELLTSVWNILAALKPGQKTKVAELAYHVETAAAVVPEVVRKVIDQVTTTHVGGPDQLESTLTAATRAITAILAGYSRVDKVCQDSQGGAFRGKLIYAVVNMFKGLLQHLTVLSAHEVVKKDDADDADTFTSDVRPSTARAVRPAKSQSTTARPATARPSASDKSKSKASTHTKPRKSQNTTDIAPLSIYTSFLGHLIDLLHPKYESNHALYEGFAFCVLDSVGKNLYTTILGRPRAVTIEQEILENPHAPPDNDAGDHGPLELSPDHKQTAIEAPYLLHLFNRVMVAAQGVYGNVHGIVKLPASSSSSNSRSNKPKSHATQKTPAKTSLAVSAKECLQRTLIHGIFGDDEAETGDGKEEEDPFREVLRMPVFMGRVAGLGVKGGRRNGKEKDGKEMLEGFVEEVWRGLGWELLGREGGLRAF